MVSTTKDLSTWRTSYKECQEHSHDLGVAKTVALGVALVALFGIALAARIHGHSLPTDCPLFWSSIATVVISTALAGALKIKKDQIDRKIEEFESKLNGSGANDHHHKEWNITNCFRKLVEED